MEQKYASLKLAVDHNELKLVKNIIATERTIHGLVVNFDFRTPEWAELTKTASFIRDGKSYLVLLDNVDECFIPWECLESKGTFTVGVFGVADGVRLPTNVLKFSVSEGCVCEGQEPAEPTQDIYEQILAMCGEANRAAQTVRDDADAGKFDGTSVTHTWDGVNLTITSASGTDVINLSVTEGEDGLTPYIGSNGNWYIGTTDTGVRASGRDGVNGVDGTPGRDGIDGKDGAPGQKGDKGEPGVAGPQGEKGEDGYTPVKGKDYYTEADKAEIVQYIDEQTAVITQDVEGLQKQINEEAHFRGYVSTNAKIQATEATPNDFAYSAESGTKWVYDEVDGWKDTGSPVPDQLTPASNATPLMDGAASVGEASEYARGDHRHPTDTTRVSNTDFDEYKNSMKTELGTLATKEELADSKKWKTLMDITLTEEQAGVSEILFAIEDAEAFTDARQCRIFVSFPVAEAKAANVFWISVNLVDKNATAYNETLLTGRNKQGSANSIFYTTAQIDIFDFKESSNTANTRGYHSLMMLPTTWYANATANTATTANECFGKFRAEWMKQTNLAPYLRITLGDTNAPTFEAGTHIFMEVCE